MIFLYLRICKLEGNKYNRNIRRGRKTPPHSLMPLCTQSNNRAVPLIDSSYLISCLPLCALQNHILKGDDD